MTVRVDRFEANKHYDTVKAWWAEQQWPTIPLSHLSEQGFVSYVDDVPAAAGWLYMTDSAFAIFEFLVANPEVRREPRAKAIEALIEKVKANADGLGFTSIFMSVTNQSLVKRLEARGFKVTDKNMTNLIHNTQGAV